MQNLSCKMVCEYCKEEGHCEYTGSRTGPDYGITCTYKLKLLRQLELENKKKWEFTVNSYSLFPEDRECCLSDPTRNIYRLQEAAERMRSAVWKAKVNSHELFPKDKELCLLDIGGEELLERCVRDFAEYKSLLAKIDSFKNRL